MFMFSKTALLTAASIVAVFMCAAVANADILPADYSFETPDASASPYYVPGIPSPWTDAALSGYTVYKSQDTSVTGFTGNQWQVFYASASGNSAVEQTIKHDAVYNTVALVAANTTYSLSTDFTNSANNVSNGYPATSITVTMSINAINRAHRSDSHFGCHCGR